MIQVCKHHLTVPGFVLFFSVDPSITLRFCLRTVIKLQRQEGSTNSVSGRPWLAQLVERQSAVWEVEGSSLRPDQHSGS